MAPAAAEAAAGAIARMLRTTAAMIVVGLVLVEIAKQWFFSKSAQQIPTGPVPVRRRHETHHIARWAFRFRRRSR